MVDIASLVCFRVAFGALMIVDLWRYSHDQWMKAAYVAPAFHFTYYGFGWVRPWPGMYLHVFALALAAAGIMLGARYRLSAALFCLGFTYVFLLEQGLYLNHFYLICLISFLLIFIPAHRALSIDAWRRPALRSSVVPAWTVWVLRASASSTSTEDSRS